MARRPRFDAPGRWFHVMNRGIARRVVFRGRADIRYFLALLARAVRRGEIEVHAFAILTTHYHLLVRSPCGKLSQAMQRIQNEYVRYFNRANRRDGPLFRGRFRSRPVTSLRYRRILVRYIDHNPVAARLVTRAIEYPYGSALLHAGSRRPRWLSRSWIEEGITAVARHLPTATYETVWGRPPTASERGLVRARIRAGSSLRDDLDDLLGAAPTAVLAWMRRKAALADASDPGLPVVAPEHVLEVIGGGQAAWGPWRLHSGRRGRPVEAWPVAQAGLLRELSALGGTAIAGHLGISDSMAFRLAARHGRLLAEPEYAGRLAELASRCLADSDAGVPGGAAAGM